MAAKYAFLVTIDNTDNRAAVVKLIKGANSLLDLVEGRDPEPTDPTVFNRYVLKPSLVGGQELPCEAWIGINTGVPAVVRNEFSQDTALWRSVEFGNIVIDRAGMQARILQLALQNGCTFGWTLIPGDALTGNLLAHFVALL